MPAMRKPAPKPLRRACLLACAMSVLLAACDYNQADPHAIYEARCANCHEPHARELVATHMKRIEGVAWLDDGSKTLKDALQSHPTPPLTSAEQAILVEHMTAMLGTGFIFGDKCATCHDRAVVFARENLVVRDGALVSAKSGRDVTKFLATHGYLKPNDIPTVVRILKRQLNQSNK